MTKERFEIIMCEQGQWVVKDNQQSPHFLDLYKCCVRMNSFCNKISELELKLAKFKSYKTDDERIRDLTNLYGQYKKENIELKQQLAEKKQELSDRESKWARWNKKDKIELLEKVRAEMYCMDGVQVNNYIDNLINELKEKLNDN